MRFLSFLALCLLIVPTVAQDESKWLHPCDSEASPVMQAAAETIDYDATCKIFTACLDEGDNDTFACQMPTYQALITECDPADDQCVARVRLTAATLTMFDNPYYGSIRDEFPIELRTAAPAMISAFEAGNYEEAIRLLENLSAENDPHPMWYYSAGVLYELLDDTDSALAAYQQALRVREDSAFTYTARAELLGELGRTDEAALDVYLLSEIAAESPGYEAVIIDLTGRYPLDDNLFEDWLRYPVESGGYGVIGSFFGDGSLEEPTPARLAFIADGDILIAENVSNLFGMTRTVASDPDEPSVIVLQRIAENMYTYRYPEYSADGITRIAFTDDIAHVREAVNYFEGGGQVSFLLGKLDSPDPREGRYPRCEGGARWRLSVGAWGRPATIYSEEAPELYFAPGGESARLFDESTWEFEVTDGPTCVDGTAWWQVRVPAGGLFWAAEADGSSYNLNPMTRPAVECPGTPRPSLHVGQSGKLAPDLGANNIRSEPTTNAEVVGSIPPEGIFNVLDGPVCADGFNWWRVDYNGLIGWTVEGQGETYYMNYE